MKPFSITRLALCGTAGCLVPIQASAQDNPSSPPAARAEDNAITEAQDAFGSTVGTESLGIYNPGSVRGFSPLDAGNIRIEGLYVDRQAEFTSRLVAGNRVLVGPGTVRESFPAPSGIADYSLRLPGSDFAAKLSGQVNSFGASLAEADFQLPLQGSRAGIAAGIGYYANRYPDRRTADVVSLAATARWTPSDAVEIIPFWSRITIRSEEAAPLFIGNGEALPPPIDRKAFLGQHWALSDKNRSNAGIIATIRPADKTTVRAGLFRSAEEVPQGASILIFAPLSGESGARSAGRFADRFGGSTSGELALSQAFGRGKLRQSLTASIRFRRQDRRYGGGDSIALPPAIFGAPGEVERPAFELGELTDDSVRQFNLGFGYRLTAGENAEIALGVQKVDYRKSIGRPGEAEAQTIARPWLFNGAGNVRLADAFRLYASYSRGLEETQVAPEFAANRDEAPPAIETRQIDAEITWSPSNGVKAIVGAFDIAKPYFGVDTDNVYRELGSVTHRGVEVSMTAAPAAGLSVVAGAMLLDSRVDGRAASGMQGGKPVGTPGSILQASLDWRPGGHSPWSIDATFTRTGREYADVANNVPLPAQTIIDLGLRYRFSPGGIPMILRLQASNLTNKFAWQVVGTNAFAPISPRGFSVRVTTDLR